MSQICSLATCIYKCKPTTCHPSGCATCECNPDPKCPLPVCPKTDVICTKGFVIGIDGKKNYFIVMKNKN